jgi:hypothetical protein
MRDIFSFFLNLFVLAPIFCFFAFFVAGIGYLAWLTATKDGWRPLAKLYRTEQPATGRVWTLQYGMVGWGSYRNVLILTANAEGLFMEVMWFVSFGRPRLFIPWRDFHNATLDTYLFWRNVKVDVGDPTITTLRLPPAIFEQSEGRKLIADQLSTQVATKAS